MRRRLSWKLALFTTIGIAIVLGYTSYVRVRRETLQFENDMRRDHRAVARTLSVAAASVAARDGREAALDMIDRTNLDSTRLQIEWVSPEPGQDVPSEVTSAIDRDADGMAHYLTTMVPATLGLGDPGWIEIRESMELENEYVEETIRRSTIILALLVLLALAINLVGGWLLLQRPMGQLIGKLERVGRGDLGGALALRRADEIGVLGRAIDVMCEQLGQLQARNEEATRARFTALEQLRHADRLKTVGQLASGVAHELGTPLNVVAARAKMIMRGESEGARAQDDARVVVEQADRMTQIIKQLLDFARRRPPHRTKEDLSRMIEGVLVLLKPLARKVGVELSVESDIDDSSAEVDTGQLQQVVTNLVMNGVQAQPKGGSVVLRLEPLVTPQAPRGGLRMVVIDEGPGMSAEVSERIFEPFFTTKDVGQGTGLGLSVAHGIVHEHGGWIDVETELGRGTRFIVNLPQGEP